MANIFTFQCFKNGMLLWLIITKQNSSFLSKRVRFGKRVKFICDLIETEGPKGENRK